MRTKIFTEQKAVIGVAMPISYEQAINEAAKKESLSKSNFLRCAIVSAINNGLPDNLPIIDGMKQTPTR